MAVLEPREYRELAESSVEAGDTDLAVVWALLFVGGELAVIRHELERMRRR